MKPVRIPVVRQLSLLLALALSQVLASAQKPAATVSPSNDMPSRIPGDPVFKHTSFTFVRIKYGVDKTNHGSSPLRWMIDYPDSDRKISARFAKVTGLKTEPEPKALELTDPTLKQYPFVYLVEPGRLVFSEAEVVALRAYLLGGGFLMADDFWGELEWQHFQRQMSRVFPNRESEDLPLSHPIFHSFYDLKEKPQVPALPHAMAGRSFERLDGREVHYRGLSDDRGRMMALFCHNTDLGDGWERDNEDADYAREYSEKRAYPMGINILVYALTR